jgi:hypothetical protein
MKSTWIVPGLLLLGWSGLALSQEPSGRLDLHTDGPTHLAVGMVGFTATDATCPQDFGVLRVHPNGWIELLAGSGVGIARQSNSHSEALDDRTQRLRIASESCRLDIDIREQGLRGGVWTQLLLRRDQRPSRTPEERYEAQRRFSEAMRLQGTEVTTEQFVDLLRNRTDPAGRLRDGFAFTSRQGIGFEDAPACFEAVGNYSIDQRGVALQFVTDLPGDLNRFVMERVELDDAHSQLTLSREDCRVAITIGASILSHDEWVARPVLPHTKRELTFQQHL